MLKRVAIVLTMTCMVGLLCGCLATVMSPVSGAVTMVKGPLTVTSNAGQTKVGTSTCMSIAGIVALGDASISKAMEAGGITRVHHVDYESFNVLGFYARFKTVVYGE